MQVKSINKLTLLALAVLQANVALAKDQEDIPTITFDQINVIDKEASSDSLLGENVILKDDASSFSLNDSLKTQRGVSLGQTIEKVSGVQNNSFGPNNGIPQIRSLTGSRVQINDNGLAVSGMAGISGNLPTAITPFLAEEITVHKSSSSVLYGGNAIGGSVNISTNQIPNELPEKAISGKLEVSGGDNTTTDYLFSLNSKMGKFAFHMDGMDSETSGYDVPGKSKADVCYDREALSDGANVAFVEACQVKARKEYFFNKGYYKYVHKDYLAQGQKYLDRYGISVSDAYKEKIPSWGKNYFVDNPDYDPSITVGKGERFKGLEDVVPTESGKMTNSHSHNKSIGIGASYVDDFGYVGIGFNHYKSKFGVPGYASLATWTGYNHAKHPVNIDNQQNRVSLESLYKPKHKVISNIRSNIAITDSENSEYLGSVFAHSLNSKQTQGRIEMNHQMSKSTNGVVGFDWQNRKTTGTGEDRYLPNTESKTYGIFAMQNFDWYKNLNSTLGYRHEVVKHNALYNDDYKDNGRFSATTAKFDLSDAFAEIKWQPLDILELKTRYSHSQRAPEVNELFASNRHFAILVDEHGKPSLKKETAKTWEIGATTEWKDTKFDVNYYNTNYEDYLYLGNTGISNKGMIRREWRQADTRINGWELELSQSFDAGIYGNIEARVFGDLVKNYPADSYEHAPDPRNIKEWNKFIRQQLDGRYMPNLPTSRYGVGISWMFDNWELGTSLTNYKAQKYLAKSTNLEPQLPSYRLLDAYVGYKFEPQKFGNIEWFLDGRNLTNAKAHPNNSTLKYLTPLAGRSVRTGIRVKF